MKHAQTETLGQMNSKVFNLLKEKFRDVHFRELLKGSFLSIVIRVLGIAVGYLFTLLVTRKFGVEAMGIFALSFTLLYVIAVIGKLGFDTALLRFVAEYSAQDKWEKVKEVYVKAVILVVPFCIFLSFLLFFISPYIAKHIFAKEELSVHFRIISFAILPMAMKFINSESLRGLKKIKEYTFFQSVSVNLVAVILLGCSPFLIKEGYVPVIALAISVGIVTIWSQLLWLKSSKLLVINSGNTITMKGLLNVSFPMLLSSSMFLIMQWTDTLMLGMFRTVSEVGIYNVVLKVAAFTSVSLFSINSIAAPKFAESYGKGDYREFEKVAQHSTKIIFWISFPILLFFYIFPTWVLGVFGEEFKGGVYALLLLTTGQFVNAISGSVGYILLMTGKQKIHQKIMLIATIMNIMINYLLIPKYGINGAAFASFISVIFWNLSMVFYIKKEFKFLVLYIPSIRKFRR